MNTQPAPVSGEWISDRSAATRLGITLAEMRLMCRTKQIRCELAKKINGHIRPHRINSGSTASKELYWVDHRAMIDLIDRGEFPRDEIARSELDQRKWREDDPETTPKLKCVLYGLLTREDVIELERRRTKFAKRLKERTR